MIRAVPALARLGQLIAAHPLTRDRQLAAWGRFARWQVDSRLNPEVVVPWLEGQRLAMRRGMTGATGNVYLGLLEFLGMMLTVHFLREDDLFLDLGANVGTYTVLASGVAGATTWAFEPDEEAVRDLERNIALNRLSERVVVHACAVGSRDGEIPFTTGMGAMNLVVEADDPAARLVPVRRLDPLTRQRSPAMIKLDVESHEEQALRGAARTLADPALKVVSTEEVTPPILQIMADNDFERAYYDPFTRRLQRTPGSLAYDRGRWTPSDQFFVRDWPFVERRLATARPVTVLGRAI